MCNEYIICERFQTEGVLVVGSIGIYEWDLQSMCTDLTSGVQAEVAPNFHNDVMLEHSKRRMMQLSCIEQYTQYQRILRWVSVPPRGRSLPLHLMSFVPKLPSEKRLIPSLFPLTDMLKHQVSELVWTSADTCHSEKRGQIQQSGGLLVGCRALGNAFLDKREAIWAQTHWEKKEKKGGVKHVLLITAEADMINYLTQMMDEAGHDV